MNKVLRGVNFLWEHTDKMDFLVGLLDCGSNGCREIMLEWRRPRIPAELNSHLNSDTVDTGRRVRHLLDKAYEFHASCSHCRMSGFGPCGTPSGSNPNTGVLALAVHSGFRDMQGGVSKAGVQRVH